jgi:hypothetical protein
MCCARGPAGSYPPRFELGSGWVGRERTISRVLSLPCGGGGHLSRAPVPRRLQRPLPEGWTSSLVTRRPDGRWGPLRGAPSYLVLLHAGFAWPAGRPAAGGLLPHHFTLTGLLAETGGVISVALSFGSPRLGITQRAALRSPDFPPRSLTERGDHPSASTRVDVTTWTGIRRWRGSPARRPLGSSPGERAGPRSHQNPGAVAEPLRGGAADRCS